MWPSRSPLNHCIVVPIKVLMNILHRIAFDPPEMIIWALNAVRWVSRSSTPVNVIFQYQFHHSYRPHMDLFSITIIGFHFIPIVFWKTQVCPYQRLTRDLKITSKSKRKDQGKFIHPIPSVYNETWCVWTPFQLLTT